MRVAAERRADGVYIAAGVALIEPETRHQSTRGDWVEPSRVARLGDKLGWQTAKRLRKATGHRSFSYTRTPVLKACACSSVYVGDPCTRHCPACKREADRPTPPGQAATAFAQQCRPQACRERD